MNYMLFNAEKLATERHAAVVNPDGSVGQVRKYTGEPYITHPKAVMELVRDNAPHTTEMLAAAWLHDTVENTATTFHEICSLFGLKVWHLVWQLTDISRPEDGNRAVRKMIDRQHLSTASADAQTIKLADLIHNSSSTMQHDPKFAKVYLAEKRALLEVLTKGDKKLWQIANNICAGIPYVPAPVSFIPFNANGAR